MQVSGASLQKAWHRSRKGWVRVCPSKSWSGQAIGCEILGFLWGVTNSLTCRGEDYSSCTKDNMS